MPKKPWHAGTYHQDSAKVRAAAWADPFTRCWRCRKTIDQCKPHRNGKPARWTAGHLNDSEIGGPLLPECSTCAASSGARYGNRLRVRSAAREATGAVQHDTSWRW